MNALLHTQKRNSLHLRVLHTTVLHLQRSVTLAAAAAERETFSGGGQLKSVGTREKKNTAENCVYGGSE